MRDTAGVPMITTPEIGFYSAKDHPSPGVGDPGSGSVRSVFVPALRGAGDIGIGNRGQIAVSDRLSNLRKILVLRATLASR